MTSEDIKKSIGKPALLKLKEVAKGIKVGLVFGNRVLVRTVVPFTDMDRVEKESILFIPETVKDANTPMPSTGIVVQLGLGVSEYDQAKLPVGTAIMFSRYAGSVAMVDEEDFRILFVEEILCTLEKKDDESN